MEERAASLIEIAERFQPASVRGIFYQAEVGRVVEKSESGYRKVQRQLVDRNRRLSGTLRAG
jgi:hypothetical protein